MCCTQNISSMPECIRAQVMQQMRIARLTQAVHSFHTLTAHQSRAVLLSNSRSRSSITIRSFMAHQDLVSAFKEIIPPLDGANYKGQHGKICVVGGSAVYTGAPYFAALSAQKAGADMTYVVCTPGAAPIIKSYSPDMIVLPFLPDAYANRASVEAQARVEQVCEWYPRMNILVVGPGLGEDSGPQAGAAQIIQWARDRDLPVIVDGSGISTVVANLDLIKGYKRCVLTPNIAELGRLAAAVGVQLTGSIGAQWQEHAQSIAAALDGPVLVSKGPRDIITDGKRSLECHEQGGFKRCGGIGDVLAGTVGTFVHWALPKHTGSSSSSQVPSDQTTQQLMVAAYAACVLLRHSSRAAFQDAGRAMVAEDVIAHLPKAFIAQFGH